MDIPHDPYAALRGRDFPCLLACSVLASVASEMQAVAVGWELYLRTHSANALGLVGLAQFVPVFLLSLPAGHAADRFGRKGQLMASLALAALASAGLAALSGAGGPIPLVYLALFLAGVSRAFSAPARWSLLPQLVPPESLASAIAWNSSGWQTASVVGPALGGLVLATPAGPVGAYVLAGLCSLAAAGLLVPIRPRPGPRSSRAVSLDALLAGIRFTYRTKPILATITLDLFAVLLGGAVALLPIFASDILHVGPTGLGWLRAAPALGALLMAITLAHRPPLRRPGVALLAAVAGFGAATVGFGLSRSPVLSFVLLALTGALDNVSVVVRGTLVQVLTPDAMRGRVSAVNAIFIGSSNELGAYESGVTAQWFGPVLSVVGGGCGTLLVVAVVLLAWPEILLLGPLDRIRPEQAPEPISAGKGADD